MRKQDLKNNRKPSILICDDAIDFTHAVQNILSKKYRCIVSHTVERALSLLKKNFFDGIILDIDFDSKTKGLIAIESIRKLSPETKIIMCSGRIDFETVQEALRRGCHDYTSKNLFPQDLLHALDRLFKNYKFHSAHYSLIGSSLHIQNLKKQISKAINSKANILITGESGTGKEIVARSIHSEGPFISIDSATIHESTAEGILFGYLKGAFTGADADRAGLFESAHGGTLFLDEISNMNLNIQSKLLRVLQEREVTRMGSSKTIPTNFRLICATNQNLEDQCSKGLFKNDLFQRLNVIPISLIPLKERQEDIIDLVNHYIRLNNNQISFTSNALEQLKQYPWPGNVRELSNLITNLTSMSDHSKIDLKDLPLKFHKQTNSHLNESESFYQKTSLFEKQTLIQAYQRYQGNISKMAAGLKMDRSHLYVKLKKLKILVPLEKHT